MEETKNNFITNENKEILTEASLAEETNE